MYIYIYIYIIYIIYIYIYSTYLLCVLILLYFRIIKSLSGKKIFLHGVNHFFMNFNSRNIPLCFINYYNYLKHRNNISIR